MKTTVLTLALFAACFSAQAQSAKTAAPATTTAPAGYTEQLGALVSDLMRTGDPAQLTELAAKLERAGAAAPTDWLPRYYRAYALTIAAFQSKENGAAKDQMLDQAEAALTQARKLHGDESELTTLQAYVYQARLRVSPMLRGQEYSGKVNVAVAEAKRLNPANPRPYLIGANNVYFAPAMFGGGAEAARPLYLEAKAKFEAFKPATPLAPSWGEQQLKAKLATYEATTAAK